MVLSNANDIIAERVNIVDVVSRYVKLQRAGRNYKGLCPFHREKTPSFNVNEERQYYYCFGCHASGNVITFLMNIESLGFVDAVKRLAREYNIDELLTEQAPVDMQKKQLRDAVEQVNRDAARYFHNALQQSESAREYLAGRNISDDSITRFGIGYADSGDGFIEHMRNCGHSLDVLRESSLVRLTRDGRARGFFFDRIMFPIIHRRKVVGFGGRALSDGGPKYLNSSDTPLFSKRRQLYGYDTMRRHLRETPYVIVTEGYFDVVSLARAGIGTAVASLGTAVTAEHLFLLSQHRSPVVLLLDGDKAGRRAAKKTLELDMPPDIDLRVAFIPGDGEDPDSMVQRDGGTAELMKLVKDALPLFQTELDSLIADYRGTANLEVRISLQQRIRDLLSRVPAKKRYSYASYVMKRTDIRKHMLGSKSRREHTSRNNPEPPAQRINNDNPARRLLNEIFYLALTFESLIPALERIEGISLLRHDTDSMMPALFTIRDEGGGTDELTVEIPGSDMFARKYDGLDHRQAERNLDALLLRLLIMENTEKQKMITFSDGDEEKRMKLKLLEEKNNLKRELDTLRNTL